MQESRGLCFALVEACGDSSLAQSHCGKILWDGEVVLSSSFALMDCILCIELLIMFKDSVRLD
jgi:hypothetical protein